MFISTKRALSPAIKNSLWMIADQFGSKLLLTGLMVLMARSLGPANFGILSLALSIVLVCKDTLAPLGLSGVFVRELIENPTRHDELLGSALAMRTLSGFGALLLALAIFDYMGPGRDNLFQIGVVLSTVIVLPSIIHLYFESALASWRNAISNLTAHATAAVATLLMYLLNTHILGFAYALALLYFVQFSTQLYQFVTVQGGLAHLRIRLQTMGSLLSESWPLIISGAAAVVYNRIDVVMLGALAPMTEVGTYAAASRVAESTTIIGLAIAASVFPSIIRARQQNKSSVEAPMIRLASCLLYCGIAISVSLILVAPHVINFLFDTGFQESIKILQVYSLSIPFIYLGLFLSKWLIVERLVRYSIVRHFLGAFVNVILNAALIPYYGGVGAAIGTVAAHCFAVCVVCVGSKPLRPALTIMLASTLWPFRWIIQQWQSLGRIWHGNA